MRQGPNGRRPRGRPNRKQHGGPSRPNSYDSGGPDGRIRGNAHQVYEKYIGLARDAISAGDRVAAEAYYQYAEHYFRIVNSSTDPVTAERRPPRSEGNGRDADTREADPVEARDPGPTSRDSGPARPGRPGQAPRGQEGRRDGTARNAGERQPPRGAPSDNAQSAPAAPRRAVEDRAGLDRVLGKEEAQSPQAASDGPPDREPGQTSPRRRSRPRQETEAAGDGAAPRERPEDGSGNGEASLGAPAQDGVAGETAPDRQEATETAAPREKDQGSEPAGT